jgi:hypothetical protein
MGWWNKPRAPDIAGLGRTAPMGRRERAYV